MFAIVAEIMNGKFMMTDPQKDVMTELGNLVTLYVYIQLHSNSKIKNLI